MSNDKPYESFHVKSVGFAQPQEVGIFSYDEGGLEPEKFRLTTRYTGISAGTELSFFQGSNPYLTGSWDNQMKLFRSGAAQSYPIWFMGYMECGQVVATNTDAVREGQHIAMTYGHKSGHTAHERDYYTILPDDFDPILGIYVGQMGPIVANGILHADDDMAPVPAPFIGAGLRDAYVLVLGTGVIGFLTALWAKWVGAREVAIVGRNPHRLALATKLGFVPLNNYEMDVSWWIKSRWQDDNEGDRGADVAFQCSGSADLLDLGLKCLRPQRTMIDLGFYQGEASGLHLGSEFHHNGLRHICAQIFRVPLRQRSVWHNRRLRMETIRFLQANGETIREHLINRVVPFSQAQSVYDELSRGSSPALQAVLTPD